MIRRDSPSEKRQSLEFNLEAANVNSNIFYDFPLCYLSWIGNGHPIFLPADTPDPITLIYPLKYDLFLF